MSPKETNTMSRSDGVSKGRRQIVRTQADFFLLLGIKPQLADFVTEFVEKPEIFFSLSTQRQREIEAQLDAVLALLGSE
jgi:hypothetical protein